LGDQDQTASASREHAGGEWNEGYNGGVVHVGSRNKKPAEERKAHTPCGGTMEATETKPGTCGSERYSKSLGRKRGGPS